MAGRAPSGQYEQGQKGRSLPSRRTLNFKKPIITVLEYEKVNCAGNARDDEYDCVWIEGVGHPGGPTRVWGAEVNDGRIYRLLSCYEDGKCIFTDGDFYKAGETDCIDHVNKKPLTVHSSTYDLQGRPILRSFKYGVFIQNGKKVVR